MTPHTLKTLIFCGFSILTIANTLMANGTENNSELLDKRSCEERGGLWGIHGSPLPGLKPNCLLPTSDAGLSCTSSNECESYCITDDDTPVGRVVIGRCYEWQRNAGDCLVRVENGLSTLMICTD